MGDLREIERAQQVTELQNKIKAAFPGTVMERFGPGSIAKSLHPKGLALDLKGDNLAQKAAWAIKQDGVKVVIYNRMAWNQTRGWHPYRGPNPHLNHVHVDLGP